MPATIEATELQLLDVFSDKYIFNIPPYQRPYAWTTEDVSGEIQQLDPPVFPAIERVPT